MRAAYVCVVVFLLHLHFPVGSLADELSVEQKALEFQATRFQAMIDEDVERLEEFLADDLTYGHTTGWTENKTELLETVKSRKVDYVAVTPADIKVQVYGNVAVITGLAEMQGIVGDREVNMTIRFLDVSRHTAGAWQLVAWQSVKLPAK